MTEQPKAEQAQSVPKVTVHDQATAMSPTPSATIIASNTTTAICVDERGRRIAIKKLGVPDRMRLFKLLGPLHVKNEPYFGYVALAAMVTSIDGLVEGFPSNEIQAEAMVTRLDDAGLDAIAAKVKEMGWVKDESGDRETIKN